jgi:hypothetical protein
MALKLTFTLAAEHGVSRFQIFGDSSLVIKWMKMEYVLRNFTLQLLLDEIRGILAGFNYHSFQHIFRDRNQIADCLSKYRIQLACGEWFIQEDLNGHISEYVQLPFL